MTDTKTGTFVNHESSESRLTQEFSSPGLIGDSRHLQASGDSHSRPPLHGRNKDARVEVLTHIPVGPKLKIPQQWRRPHHHVVTSMALSSAPYNPSPPCALHASAAWVKCDTKNIKMTPQLLLLTHTCTKSSVTFTAA